MAAPYPPAAAGGAPAASTEFKTRIELQIKCNDLPKMDRMSQSDPLCLVEIERAGSYSEVQAIILHADAGRTGTFMTLSSTPSKTIGSTKT